MSSSSSYPFTSISISNRRFTGNVIKEADNVISKIIKNDDSIEEMFRNEIQIEICLYRAIELFIINPSPSPINQVLTFENLLNVRNKLYEIVTKKSIALPKFDGNMIFSQFFKYDNNYFGDSLKNNPARYRRFCRVVSNIDKVSIVVGNELYLYDLIKIPPRGINVLERDEIRTYTALIYIIVNNCNHKIVDTELSKLLQVTVFSICQTVVEKLLNTQIDLPAELSILPRKSGPVIIPRDVLESLIKDLDNLGSVFRRNYNSGGDSDDDVLTNDTIFKNYVKPEDIIEDIKTYNARARNLSFVVMSEYPMYFFEQYDEDSEGPKDGTAWLEEIENRARLERLRESMHRAEERIRKRIRETQRPWTFGRTEESVPELIHIPRAARVGDVRPRPWEEREERQAQRPRYESDSDNFFMYFY
jgi:hypothetical protein